MKAKSAVLTKEERDVLILTATCQGGQRLNNTKIAQRLGISVSGVKKLIHQACVKLGANNRNNAILSAVIHREIRLDEFLSLDELAELISTVHPDTLRKIAYLVREGQGHGRILGEDEQITSTDRRQDTILTKCEQDVLILAGRGFTNREIADTLYITIHTVKTYLYRACTKLETHKRADAVMLALKQGEICIGDMFSLNELLPLFAPLGANSIEEIAQIMSQKLGQEPVPTGS